MKRFLFALTMLALFPALTPTQTPPPPPPVPPAPPTGVTLSIPAQVTGMVGDFIQVTATTSADNISWKVHKDNQSLKLLPCNKLKDPKTAWLTSGMPGTFNLYCCAGGKDGLTTIEVCSVQINPMPTPPPPPSPIVGLLQAAFAADPDPKKVKYAADFSELFLNIMDDSTLNTATKILNRIQEGRKGLIGEALPAERKVINAYLQGLFKAAPDAVLDPATLASIKAEFVNIGQALQNLGTP